MSGGAKQAAETSKSPKKKDTVVVANMDGVARATTSHNASGERGGGGSKDHRREHKDGGGGRGGEKPKKRNPNTSLGHIEGEPRFTGREMRLTAAVAILTILLFGIAAFTVVSGPLSDLLNPRCLDEKLGYAGLCDSEECIDISYRSVHSANFTADPCEDFYSFACSKWQTGNPISEEQLIFAANINQLKDSVDSFLKTLLEEETPSHKADPGVTALKNFYKSCINFTDPDENELILDLMDSLGGYKTPDIWSDNTYDLTETILKFLKVNAAPLFDLTLDIDAKNRERYALIVELPRPTSLVPNLFRPPRQDDDLMNSETYAYYNLIEGNEPISFLDVTPGLLNTTSRSSSTRPSSTASGDGSSGSSNNSRSTNGSGSENGSNSFNNSSTLPGGSTTVDRHALYKMIKDSMDAKKREDLKSLVRKVGQMIRMSEAEILSDSHDVAVIASNIEKIKPSQRSRKFWKQQNKEFNAYTLDQLQHQFGNVQWSFLFGELMGFDDVASRETGDDYYTGGSGSGSSGGTRDNKESNQQKGSRNNGNSSATINWHNSTIYVPYPDYLRRILQMTQYTNKRMLHNTMLILYVKDMLHDLMPRSHSSHINARKEEGGKQQKSHHQRVGNSESQQHGGRVHHHSKQQQRRQEAHHQHHLHKQQGQQTHSRQPQQRWKFCVQSTKSVFAMELSSLYMKSFDPSNLKRIAQDLEKIFVNVKETLITFLNRSVELSPDSKSSNEDDGPKPEEDEQQSSNNHFPNNNYSHHHNNNDNHNQLNVQQDKKRNGNNVEESGSGNSDDDSYGGMSNNENGRMDISEAQGRAGSKSRHNSSSSSYREANINVDSRYYHFSNNDGKSSFRHEAIRKIATLKGNFLGPSFYLQEDFLDDAVKMIRIDPNNFLFNVKVVYRTFREQLYHLYWKPVDEERATWAFVTFPTTVNAFYIPQFNSIVIPLAFLNPPNYVQGAPIYINYATIAHTLAHEALHALDRSGSGFDADGRLHDLSEAEPKAFLQEKANCVAKQYSENFRTILPFYQSHVLIQVDGNLTQNENLADIAGLQVAFSAYRKYRLGATKDDLKTERRIPGLVLTLEQAYFFTFAQAYCANISPMGYIFFLEMEEHTPHPERINGMLMNTPEFAEAYSCRAGTLMNPPLKCSVW